MPCLHNFPNLQKCDWLQIDTEHPQNGPGKLGLKDACISICLHQICKLYPRGITQIWVGYRYPARSFNHRPISKLKKMQICNLCLNHLWWLSSQFVAWAPVFLIWRGLSFITDETLGSVLKVLVLIWKEILSRNLINLFNNSGQIDCMYVLLECSCNKMMHLWWDFDASYVWDHTLYVEFVSSLYWVHI